MTPQVISLSSLGSTAWIPVDYKQNPFNIGLACVVSNTPNLTYQVEFTLDDIFNPTITPTAFTHNTIIGRTSDFSSNQTNPVRAIRLTTTAYTSGTVTMTALQGIINPIIYASNPVTLYKFEIPSWSSPTVIWDSAKYPIIPSISVGLDGSMRGNAGITPEALFDFYSAARITPTNTYYVDIATGSDSNSGTSGSKFKSIRKAIDAGNTAAAPFKVFVTAGEYDRVNTFYGNPGTTPTQDCAFIAVGGTVVCGTWDSFTASADGTHTNTYSFSLTNVIRCLDLLNKNPDGTYKQLVNVATAALCNLRPGSWASVAGTIYVNRGDGAAVTTSNTRVLRQAPILYLPNTAQVSVYVGADTQDCGWEMHGSDTTATLRQICTTVTASNKALVVKNCAFQFAGGFGAATARCVAVDSYPGITAFFDCVCNISTSDGFNFKNTAPASPAPSCLTVNCSGTTFGDVGSTSNNSWTLHNDVLGIDICGKYQASSGGNIHNINTSKAALFGTTIIDDAGDRHFGGTIYPTAVRAANTAEIQMYGCAILQPFGIHLHAADTAVIVTDADITRLRTAGNVTQRS